VAADEGRAVGPAVQDGVERAQQPGRWERRHVRRGGQANPVAERDDLVGDGVERPARVPERDARPGREVLRRGGSVPGEVAAGQSLERLRTVEAGRRRAEPGRGRRERVLRTDHRPAHDVSAQARRDEDVDERLPGRRYAGAVESATQLFPGLRAFRDRLGDDGDTPIGLRRADALLLEAARVPGRQPRCRQELHPPVVLRRHQVERPPVQPADDQ
jgi:hypothetical protein